MRTVYYGHKPEKKFVLRQKSANRLRCLWTIKLCSKEVCMKNSMYPATFVHLVTKTYGARGTQWLGDLPSLIAACADHWRLTQLVPYPNLTYGYVLAGMRADEPVVLKLYCDKVRFAQEEKALAAFAGHGCIRRLAVSYDRRALLLERAVPGHSLVSYFPHDDNAAIAIASSVITQLHGAPVPASNSFETVNMLLPDFSVAQPLLEPFRVQAQTLKEQLLATTKHHVLLHGDVHYDNILAHKTNWLAIDPQGVIGDPVYDVTVCIRHPLTQLLEQPYPIRIIVNRIDHFAYHLGWEAQRIYDWTFVQTVAAAWWSIEDGLDATRHVAFLKLLQNIRL